MGNKLLVEENILTVPCNEKIACQRRYRNCSWYLLLVSFVMPIDTPHSLTEVEFEHDLV